MAKFVMPGLVPGIHVLASPQQGRRGWPGRSPAMTENESFSSVTEEPEKSWLHFRSDSQVVLRIPLRAFLALFFVFLLTLLAVVLAALLDRRAVDFFATFPAALLTVFFARVFLLAFATRLEAARFLRGA